MIVKREFFIGFRDVDVNSKMKNSSILNLFQNIACIHSIEIGRKFKGMASTWILTGYKVDIKKRPVYGQIVTASTWVKEMKNILAVREFEIRDEEGNVMVTAISNWAHMSNNKLSKIPEGSEESYGLEPDVTNYDVSKLTKIQEPENFKFEKSYNIDWNWIDVNHHLNNIYYMDIVDMVIPDDKKTEMCKSFEISYKKEVKYNEKIKVFYVEENDNCWIVVKSEDLSVVHTVIKLVY